jgi:hypothetical protein
MKNHNTKWMAISGATGIVLFLIANFTMIFSNASVMAGCLQILVNLFVFVTYSKGFIHGKGVKKFIAFFGVIVPIIMASITIRRVLLPYMLT